MKKLFAALFLAAVTSISAVASDGFAYGVWFDSPLETATTDIEGLGLGILILDCRNIDGIALSLLGTSGKNTAGFEWSIFFNKAATLEGVQIALINIHHGEVGDFAFQLGGYNHSSKGGIQIGIINNCRNNAAFQLGIVNVNKKGMFPIMVLVNFADGAFDD